MISIGHRSLERPIRLALDLPLTIRMAHPKVSGASVYTWELSLPCTILIMLRGWSCSREVHVRRSQLQDAGACC